MLHSHTNASAAASAPAPESPRQSTTTAVWDARQLRIATDAAGVALWSWNVDTDEIALDERAHRLWGIPAGDSLVTFEALSARLHPEDLDRVRAAFASTRAIFGAYEIDFRIVNNGSVRWISARGRGDDQGIVGRIMFGIFLDVSERKAVEQERETIATEMSHRISNLFATIAALARISARSTLTPAAMADDIVRRLVALSKAKELVRPSRTHPSGSIDLGALLTALLSAYDDTGANGEHIRVSVPKILVGETSVTTLALVIHELATNSLKYGALSAASGTLAVMGTIHDDQLTVVWTERGGPPVAAAPGHAGFGSQLIRRSIVDQLDGAILFAWPEAGVIVTIRIGLERLGT